MEFRAQLNSFRYYHPSGLPIGMYSCVSLAEGSEITDANAAGVPGEFGEICVITPVGIVGGITTATRRILGVVQGSQYSGQMVTVATSGVAYVLANAPIGGSSANFVHAVVSTTRTAIQTPFLNNLEMLLPRDPRSPAMSYAINRCDDPAITPQSTNANVQYFPLGWPLKVATAQEDIIPVELFCGSIFA